MPGPIVLSTWTFGQVANRAAWPLLAAGGSSLDAVEAGCRAVEADPENMTVGPGSYPDRGGEVSLDAAIMVAPDRCGGVCFVRRYVHPITLARLVMEKSPHVLLAGDGAERLAAAHGLAAAEVTTAWSREAWRKWAAERPEECADSAAAALPETNIEERRTTETPGERDAIYDTVGVLALDREGRLAGGCSTSGRAFKLPGRVGDSPIIGQGLYVEPGVGAAVATGTGELITGVCGTFLAVELLRRGAALVEAACEPLERIRRCFTLEPQHQAVLLVMDPAGRWTAAALRPGYRTAVRDSLRDELVEPERVLLG